MRTAAGTVDHAAWQRAEAWALHCAVVYLVHSADDPLMGALGERLLRRLIDVAS